MPGIKQKNIDIYFTKYNQQKAFLTNQIKEFKPGFIAFSWRNIQMFAPHEDSPALRTVFKYDHSHFLDKIKAAASGSAMLFDFSYQIKHNIDFLKHIKKYFPDIKLIVGGTAFSIFPKELIKKCPEETVGVIGEGESVLLKYLKGEDILSEDVVIKKNGKVIRGSGPSYIDMQELAPVDFENINRIFDKFSYFVKNDYIGIQTKRGCPFRCMFCLYNKIEGDTQRFKNTKSVATEIENLRNKFGVKNIWFTDSQFCASKKSIRYSEELIDELLSRKLDITWTGNIRVELLDKSFIQKAVDSGLRELHLTFTGSQKVIDKLNLGYKLDDQLKALDSFYNVRSDSKIKFKLYTVLNVPGETKETLLETVNICKNLKEKYGNLVYPYIFLLAVQPNTPLEKYAIENGYLNENYDPLSTNPWVVKKLLYNPPPLGRTVAKSFLAAYKSSKDKGNIGWKTLSNIENNLLH